MATDQLTPKRSERFLPAGYLFKRVSARPDWLAAPQVEAIHSVSGCISADFADYVPHWKHNGFWLFDSAAAMRPVAAEAGADPVGLTLFYYEVLAEEFHETDRNWNPVEREPSLPLAVVPPDASILSGFDVVSFSAGNAPECSPLSCNGLAAHLPANRFCLFDSVEAARVALEAGGFDISEPGPFRIMAVHVVPQPQSVA